MDIVSKEVRSKMMACIKSKDTAPEILIRSRLHRRGFRFRKNVKALAGRPDIVLAKFKSVVMVHGCFWHGHACSKFRLPKTNTDFWTKKIGQNRTRDKSIEDLLKSAGWNVIIVWECEVLNSVDDLIESLTRKIVSGK